MLAIRKTWTGYGGDSNWSNPLNWSEQAIPRSADDVLLDNGDLPVSYQVILPDDAVMLKTIQITPSPGRNIELVLPATNKITDAFSVTGPGYGITLNAGAIFRNASGLASGESLFIADSMIILDGARYIHQTRAAHANRILKILSTAPGTEEGIFDFDVPKSAYTISVSNRTYGSLELHAGANGNVVSYTCTGANPLLIQGNFRIGSNVHLSMNLSGTNGNIQVLRDFIQEGGQLNLASGGNHNTMFRVKGDLYQSPSAIITETAGGSPLLELNGGREQEVAMAGQILQQVGFRMNNPSGARLRLPLSLPWKLELNQGVVFTTSPNLLILNAGCIIEIDSTVLTGSYIEGPVRKLGLTGEDHFLFPVGKDGNLRWLELKEAAGNYTVEYQHQDPGSIGTNLGTGLDHISRLEYWILNADGPISNQAKIELSFTASQSGGVTDPNFLNVARFQSSAWEDAGHSAFTGNFIQGSVLSANADFAAIYYTLASTINLENPLPLISLNLEVHEISGEPVFSWEVRSPDQPAYFDLCEETGNQDLSLVRIAGVNQQTRYTWTSNRIFQYGDHYFSIRMTDIHGHVFPGKKVFYKKGSDDIRISCIPEVFSGGSTGILIRSVMPGNWGYDILSMDGRMIKSGNFQFDNSIHAVTIFPENVSSGMYIFRAMDPGGKNYSLIFKKN